MADTIKISALPLRRFSDVQAAGVMPVSIPSSETYRVPVRDFASEAQGLKADSAYQKPTSGIPKTMPLQTVVKGSKRRSKKD